MQDLRTVEAIAKRDVLEHNIAANGGQRSAGRIVSRLRCGIEDVAEPRNRDARLVEVLTQLREPQDRLRHTSRQHIEGDEFADRKITIDDEVGAEVER